MNPADWLAYAAFVLSVLALAIAVGTMLYTRDQARATIRATDLAEDRRRDELTPILSGEYTEAGRNDYGRLVLTLNGPRTMTRVSVELLEGPDRPTWIAGIRSENVTSQRAIADSLPVGGHLVYPVEETAKGPWGVL